MKIYNTLTGKKEEFVPGGDQVKMYVCGVTPYDSSHIGHAMSYINFDVVRRYLAFKGYKVRYVQNFTDIDDKIIARANKLGISAQELATRFIDEYFEDMDALNIMRADVYPRATEEVADIIRVVSGLIEKGHAYELKGDVYFRVRSADKYGKLSHRNLDDMRAGARIEVDEAKEYPLDFALWKASKPGEPSWESPWGKGRPGWHIECSVMSIKYLGNTLDIHGGGQDLIFPHHENEIAQSEAFTGEPFVRCWMHNGLLQLGQDKMSKSLGNLITVKQILEKSTADALRLFVLSSHYRSPLNYSDEGLSAMEKGAERLRRAATLEDVKTPSRLLDAAPYRQRFIEAMDDDFNTAQAVGSLFDLAREINRAKEEGISIVEAQKELSELSGVLGLEMEEEKHEFDAGPFVDLLIDVRTQLRSAKQWQMADVIRNRLLELGIALEDTPKGTVWKQKG
ncbi:MAG: cysteine--tRNA ligase [Dehalococcoidia bacterium]|nr:cysteine--tRNA ligase [Dehalococcoidia bacterium]